MILLISKNRVKAVEYTREKVESIKRSLSINGYENICIEINECEGDIYFNLPPFDISEIHLHAGFGEIWTGFHYCQTTMHVNKEFHIHKMAYEIVGIFGEKEVWYCQDYDCEELDMDFNQWMQFMTEKYGPPVEFNIDKILKIEKESGGYAEPKLFYHDNFIDYKIH